MKSIVFVSIAFIAVCGAFGRAVSMTFTPPVQNRHRCEFCERMARAGRILKGHHLVEWRKVKAMHESTCPFAINHRHKRTNMRVAR